MSRDLSGGPNQAFANVMQHFRPLVRAHGCGDDLCLTFRVNFVVFIQMDNKIVWNHDAKHGTR